MVECMGSYPVENDSDPRSFIIPAGLKTLFQRQLPMMPWEYIAGQGSSKGVKEVFVANIASVRVVVPPMRVAEAPSAGALYRKVPFMPSGKGKQHKIVFIE